MAHLRRWLPLALVAAYLEYASLGPAAAALQLGRLKPPELKRTHSALRGLAVHAFRFSEAARQAISLVQGFPDVSQAVLGSAGGVGESVVPAGRVRDSLTALRDAATKNDVNMMPYILECVRAYATLGEICDELRGVYGVYEEPAF